jgi:hypothetical protein
MTRKQLWEKVNKENSKLLCNLWERWQDEKEYEDINDYLTAIQKHIPEAKTISKRPFGVMCLCDDGNIKISVKLKGNYLTINGETAK